MTTVPETFRTCHLHWFWFISYNLILNLFTVLLRWRSRWDSNLNEAFEGRRGIWNRLEQALAERYWEQPLIWFHVASAGEWLQAQPVIKRCVEHGAQCFLTYSSINARRWFERREESPPELLAHDFLPLDQTSSAYRLLGLIQPSRIVWVSYDLWPNLVWAASRRGIPQMLISGIVHASSHRNKGRLTRLFYRNIYRCLEGMYMVSEADRDRIARVVPGHTGLSVMGDTRFDSVLERREQLSEPVWPDGFGKGTLLVAGSTWPRDEECIFPVFKEALQDFPELQLVLVPHEPTGEHLNNAEEFFTEFSMIRWTRREQSMPGLRILLIDRIGLLAGLYRGADLAYVGAGFTTGVHNTMEPASMGLPVFFGPKFDNAIEAVEMVRHGTAFSIRDSDEFRRLLIPLLENPESTKELGLKARDFIESMAGTSERCVRSILQGLV